MHRQDRRDARSVLPAHRVSLLEEVRRAPHIQTVEDSHALIQVPQRAHPRQVRQHLDARSQRSFRNKSVRDIRAATLRCCEGAAKARPRLPDRALPQPRRERCANPLVILARSMEISLIGALVRRSAGR